MIDMPRPRPPSLHREFTRHGKAVWYVRVNRGNRIRIRAEYGSDEFNAAYQDAISGAPKPVKTAHKQSGTVAWAAALYRESTAWGDMSIATRRQRDNILKKIVESAGGSDLTEITRTHIVEGRERRAKTPAAARHFIETMRGLFRWAVDRDLVKADPTEGVKPPKKAKGDGFAAWVEADLLKFDARWPLGTRERVAKDVLYYTGLRRGDAVVFGRPHVKDGVGRLTTEKTGERVTVPLEPELVASLSAGPIGDLTYITSEAGKPLKKESFGNWFRQACAVAGVKKSAHGLRKAGATRDANRGWTESELEAKYGWRGGRMASHYTQTMNRDRLALQAAQRTATGTSIPAPVIGCGPEVEKTSEIKWQK